MIYTGSHNSGIFVSTAFRFYLGMDNYYMYHLVLTHEYMYALTGHTTTKERDLFHDVVGAQYIKTDK